MEHGLKDIAFCVKKHITPCTVVITSLLVRDNPLGVPASVKQAYSDTWWHRQDTNSDADDPRRSGPTDPVISSSCKTPKYKYAPKQTKTRATRWPSSRPKISHLTSLLFGRSGNNILNGIAQSKLAVEEEEI